MVDWFFFSFCTYHNVSSIILFSFFFLNRFISLFFFTPSLGLKIELSANSVWLLLLLLHHLLDFFAVVSFFCLFIHFFWTHWRIKRDLCLIKQKSTVFYDRSLISHVRTMKLNLLFDILNEQKKRKEKNEITITNQTKKKKKKN